MQVCSMGQISENNREKVEFMIINNSIWFDLLLEKYLFNKLKY